MNIYLKGNADALKILGLTKLSGVGSSFFKGLEDAYTAAGTKGNFEGLYHGPASAGGHIKSMINNATSATPDAAFDYAGNIGGAIGSLRKPAKALGLAGLTAGTMYGGYRMLGDHGYAGGPQNNIYVQR